MKKVVALIVTYNRKQILKECIEALLKQEYEKCDIFIIDNASTDGTFDYIKHFIDNKKVYYKNTGSNLGGAGGFNFGLKCVAKMDYDFIWIMDDDCIVQKKSLVKLLKADEKLKGDYGFLSSKVLWKDDQICQMNIQRKTLFKNMKNFNSDLQEVVMASFVSFFIKRETVLEIGLPIKEFFIWTDDWEYSRRISQKYKCYFVSESVVNHKTTKNIGAKIWSDDDNRLERFKFLFRNDMYLYKREGIKGLLYMAIRVIYSALRILFSKCRNKKNRLMILMKSTIKGFGFNPKIEFVDKK